MGSAYLRAVAHKRTDLVEAFALRRQLASERVPKIEAGPLEARGDLGGAEIP